ncbi:MAG TPA: N-acetylmuramoyl-L-alanine amidase [Mobilitalea sp.]|nr:N-acetylmuramoyl-L-alanine amidase [Mobilitalea sp.]
MNKSLLKKAAIQSVALMIAVITLSYAMRSYQAVTIEASNMTKTNAAAANDVSDRGGDIITLDQSQPNQTITVPENSLNQESLDTPITDLQDLKSRIDPTVLNKLSNNFLMIKKPKGENITLQLEDQYINQSIQLDFTGMEDSNITSDMILRVKGSDMFTGDPAFTEMKSMEVDKEKGTSQEVITKDFGDDLSHGITITTQAEAKSNLYSSQVQITLDSVYAYMIYEDNNYFYIDLRKPSEVYDKIIVIDAGHGGKDVGAISKGDKYYEKNINLDIVLQLKKLLDQENIKVYYTRTSDTTVYLRPRASLANAVDCDYFISIHCNSNKVTSPNGTEVLYYDTDFKGVKAFDLANLFSNEIAKTTTLKQRGIIRKGNDDIYILDKSKIPTILIEAGYLSNNNDMDYLSNSEYRMAIAQGIFNAIIEAYNELPVAK